MDDVQLTLIDSVDGALEFKRWLGERRPVLAFDTETGGLEAWAQPLRLVQFGDAQHGWTIPWFKWGGVALEALKEYDGPLVAHNAKFDVGFIERHSQFRFPWHLVHDTMIQAHLLDPVNSVALKHLATLKVHPKAAAGQELLGQAMKQQGWNWGSVPVEFPAYWAYAGLDCVLTARLHELQFPEVASSYKEVYELEMASTRVCMGMEQRGARIDVDYCQRALQELLDFCEQVQVYCGAMYGVQNIGSNAQVTEKLIELGVELTEKTPTGKWKLDEDVIESIHHDLADQVRNHHKAKKIANTYFKNFIDKHDHGRLHPNIRVLGARTGRMSITDPALQTLPRGRVVRDAFIPDEECLLLSADMDQIEMRLLAHFSQDPGLIDAINSGDLHTETARRVYGDASIAKKDPRRQTAKNAGFAKIYGAGVEKFAKTAGIPLAEATAFLSAYDTMFPGVRTFQTYVEQIAAQRQREDGVAWVKSPIGRRHVADEWKNYTLVNYLIQGTAGDVLKQMLVDLDLVGLGEMLVVPVHDEVILNVPKPDVPEVAELVRRTMTRTEWAVPLTAGVEGPFERWGVKYDT